MSTAIEFDHVSKQYRLGLVSTGTLSHDLNRWWAVNILRKEDPYLKVGSVNDRSKKADSEYVWALNDIDFKVEQGDVVGIIGKNGAGKSTLLKLLSRVTGPTLGTIKAKGRIGSLLEVGTGFHPELTGKENIFMNGAILGMTKTEINNKLDEIIDFSGCERYIDTPVKLVDFLRQQGDADPSTQRFVCYCSGDDRHTLRQLYTPGTDALVLIGPEGDFSPDELSRCLTLGFQPVTLGNNRLRTETAALYALTALNFMNGDLRIES